MTLPSGFRVNSRIRIISDNDYSGDPDGLVQLAHHLLSPSCEIRAIIGSHLGADDGAWRTNSESAADAVAKVRELLAIGRFGQGIPVFQGSNHAMQAIDEPIANAAVEFIIEEAMRSDTDAPLFVVCGGSLTQIASAWLREPRIGERLTVIWIGGAEHAGRHIPQGVPQLEYNLAEDILAAQVVFNHSNLNLWQIPRDAYRQTIFSMAELSVRWSQTGPLGAYLASQIEFAVTRFESQGRRLGETYVLGDSPLVLLTALQTPYEPDTASSVHEIIPCPTLNSDGTYSENPNGRSIRVYRTIDNRLMFEDFCAKLALLANSQESNR